MINKYAHIRPSTHNHSGGFTIAFSSESKDSTNIKYAVAFCNPKDNFNKARGRQIALGRLNSDRGMSREISVNSSKYRDIVDSILADLGHES